jgi:1,4-dihydroxy-2-naphthoate polyprenyltransferase
MKAKAGAATIAPAVTSASRLDVWLSAMRPRTLPMALSPVFVGACFAQAFAGGVNAPAVGVAALSAVCIQIATNLYNDAADFERGGDGPDRLGPKRAAASGLLAAEEIKRAAFAFFALAAFGGLYLVAVGGWPILALGVLSILSGWAYAGGPAPISYSPFGEVFVIAFFGLGAVGGTFWLSAGSLQAQPLLAGLALGLFAAGVLMINNYRDAAADARIGRRTLAIVAGPRAARALFAAMMAAPFALLLLMIAAAPGRALWLAFGAAPFAWAQARALAAEAPGPGLNRVLARTALTQALFAFLLGLGALT